MNSPCKECESRTASCHDGCTAYRIYRAALNARLERRQEMKRQENLLEEYVSSRKTKQIRRKK